MRVCLFTDTLGDVNGVSRFIRNVADQAAGSGRDLTVITSTRMTCPRQPNIVNVPPPYARAMPGYPNLEVVLPPTGGLIAEARRRRPDVIHVSTPGPVGRAGVLAARRMGVPLIGTYHTDFPAYVEHLFQDAVCTWLCTKVMSRFYRPFSKLFTRSLDYADAMERLGVRRGDIVKLLPGIDTDTFHTRHRPSDVDAFWRRYPGVDPAAVKVLYVGRVSVEKNLPYLARVWKATRSLIHDRAQLIVIGDGPYRRPMEIDLAGRGGVFLGFRHGVELSQLYAASDLFAFPSTTDTLGQVVMEAQSAGLPVIVTDQGGPSEVVVRDPEPAATGFVLSADDAQGWARTIARLVTDPGLRATMGAAAHALIQPMSIRHSFEHFWSVHEEVAAEAHLDRGAPLGMFQAAPHSGHAVKPSAPGAVPARS
jgi:glycosyltransferase involved in cell wall biosynthesis